MAGLGCEGYLSCYTHVFGVMTRGFFCLFFLSSRVVEAYQAAAAANMSNCNPKGSLVCSILYSISEVILAFCVPFLFT